MRRLALILALLLAVGCAGAYRKLPTIEQVPDLAKLSQSADALRRQTDRVEVERVDGAPLHLAVEEIGPGETGTLVVLIHGVLSNRSTWDFLAGDLGRDHDLLLIDLLGCGESDRPEPARLGPGGYDPTSQARRVLVALRALGPDEARLVLIGHSLGGSTVLRMLGDPDLRSEFADVVERVDRAVLISPLDFAVEKVHPQFAEIAELGRVKVALASALGILPHRVAEIVLNNTVDSRNATREEALRLAGIIRRESTRKPAQAMIRESVPFDIRKRVPDWERIERLVADYGNVDVPVLILWGARDETLPVSMGYKLQAQLPRARLGVVARSKHALHVERPRLSAERIRSFIGPGGDDGPPVEYLATD